MSLQEEVEWLVTARLQAYDQIIVDLFSMAGLAEDREMQEIIWKEEWANDNVSLLAQLLLSELHLGPY